jgi:PKD repeat protein
VTTADFNRDGNLDIVAANHQSDSVSVLLGDGVGGFTRTDFAVGYTPSSVVTGDFNGDGKPDLATANYAPPGYASVSVLLGDGMGSFTRTDFAESGAARSITAGDFNRDGKLDLVVACEDLRHEGGLATVLLGDGAGSFTITDFATGDSPLSVTAGDFNGDSKLDLVTPSASSDSVFVLLGNGAGSFGAPTVFAVGTFPEYVMSADFNGDGKPDLVVSNTGSYSISVLLGDGAGGFTRSDLPTGQYPRAVGVGDLNGDGSSDIAVASSVENGSISVRLNNCLPAPAPTPTLSCITPPLGIVGWWAGDGNANDISRNGNNGTLQNSATFATGKVGQAFSLNGIDDYVNVPNSNSFDAITSAISVEAWIKPETPRSTKGFIFGRRDPNVSESFSLAVYDDGKIGVTVRTTGMHPNGSLWVSSPGIIQFGQWQHVAATFIAATGQLSVYINGQQRALSVIEGSSTFSGDLAGVHNLFIGRRQDLNDIGGIEGGSGAAYYKGLIDELTLYSRALSSSEIRAIFNAGSTGKCRTVFSPRPLTSFSFSPAAPTVGQVVHFTDSSTGPSLKRNWDFDGNGFADSTSQNPTHTFTVPGPHHVTLKVVNPYGSSTVTKTVNVNGTGNAPFVTGVTRQYPGLFFSGSGPFNRFDVSVNWNGSPGTVRFSINEAPPIVENGGSSGASHTFKMGQDFPGRLSASTITVTPVNSAGTVGPSWTERVFVSPLPSWASGSAKWFVRNGELKFSLPFEVPFPHWEAKRRVPSWVPGLAGEFGMQESS